MECLHTELKDNILTLIIDRPKANAYNHGLLTDLQKEFIKAGRDSQVRAIILTGAGKIFGAGQDLEEFRSADIELSYRQHLIQTYNPLVLQIRNIEKPVIAAINGPCAGASLGIALACDLRIASENARFVVGFSGIGLAPDCGVSMLLPAIIGLGRALEFTFTNETISVEKAREWGLVNRLTTSDGLLSSAFELASLLAKGPTGAFGLAKRVYNNSVLPNLQNALEYESYIQEIAGKRSEHKEGVAAFFEKRSANYL
ncbi:MAG: enoyl-CoA hydratase/isomerase family protein [Chloroflexota bacterium]